MVTQADLELRDGRTLHTYDALADGGDARLTVVWHHGTPNLGAPPEPLFPAAARLGIRWVSYDRPGYGGRRPHPGRDVASAAAEVASVADALGIGRFAVMGHSGGGAHALACAALTITGLRPAWAASPTTSAAPPSTAAPNLRPRPRCAATCATRAAAPGCP